MNGIARLNLNSADPGGDLNPGKGAGEGLFADMGVMERAQPVNRAFGAGDAPGVRVMVPAFIIMQEGDAEAPPIRFTRSLRIQDPGLTGENRAGEESEGKGCAQSHLKRFTAFWKPSAMLSQADSKLFAISSQALSPAACISFSFS